MFRPSPPPARMTSSTSRRATTGRTSRARSRRASASPASISRITAGRTGLSRPTPDGRRATVSALSARSRRIRWTTAIPTSARSARCRATTRTGSSPTVTRPSASVRNGERTASSRGRTDGGCTTRTSPRTSPLIVTTQNAALFSDHEMIAVDDASISPFFGNVYVCDAAFRSQEIGGFPEPIVLNSSSDGGDTWTTRQVSPSFNNNQVSGRQDCAVNTDSKGTVYVFWDGTDPKTKTLAIFMVRSFDGGKTFERAAQIVTHIDQTGIRDPESGDLTFDGVAGARDGSFPTVDIANGAPNGVGATDEIVLAWSNGPTPSDAHPGPNEQLPVLWSKNGGGQWFSGGIASPAADRPDFPAVAISPDGGDAYVTYMNFLQPWQSTTAAPRLFGGVVRHAEVNRTTGAIGAWSDIHRAPTGDARGSSANALTGEFLGDYDYAFATNDFVVAVWNDARSAADCPLIDAYRQQVVDGTATGTAADPTRPAPNNVCPATFGNSDIWGGSYADPTP